MVLKYVQLNWMYITDLGMSAYPSSTCLSLSILSFPVEVTVFFPLFSYLIPLSEVPCVALVWPDSCARVSLSKSSSKQRIRQRWGAAAARVQPCRAGLCFVLRAVVLFTERLVPQDAVHLMCDGGWQLWKNLCRERNTNNDHLLLFHVSCQSFCWTVDDSS